MKRFLIIVLSVTVAFFAAAGFAEAELVQRITYMEGNEPHFSIDLTDLWNIEIKDDDIIGISDNGKIWFFLGDVPGRTDLDGGIEQITARMSKRFDDVEVTRRLDDFDLNGLPSHAFEGVAKQNGKDVMFFVVLFQVEPNKVQTIVFIMDPSAQLLNLDEVLFLTKSLSRR